MKGTAPRLFALSASAVVLSAIALGIWENGWPGDVRIRRFDQKRVTDLLRLSNAIDAYWRADGKLPDSIGTALARETWLSGDDPETGSPYAYVVKDERAYELCAIFGYASSVPDDLPPAATIGAHDRRWAHAAGRQCFSFTTVGKPKSP